LPETFVSFELSHRFTVPPRPAARPSGGPPIPPPQAVAQDYAVRARAIEARHDAQTEDDVRALQEKYRAPVFGRVSPWSLVETLAQCIDPSDQKLYCASQQMHVLQIIDAMEAEGVATADNLLVALVHDLGKVLLVTGEAPENVVGMNRPIRGVRGAGLDACVMQWNHDEFAYSRLKDHLPDGLGWLVRYHSIMRADCEPYMDARDREYADRYLRPFARYDHGTKSPLNLPQRRLDDYRQVLERALPAVIDF
jgi:hypothetical protein